MTIARRSLAPPTFVYIAIDFGRCSPRRSALTLVGMSSARLEQPRLLPAILVPPPEGADPDRVTPRSTRDWIVDVAFFVIALLVGSAGLTTEASRGDIPPTTLATATACGLLAASLLWLRRRQPVGVAVACLALAAFSTFAVPAAVLALFTVAVHRRLAVVAAVAAFSLAVLPVNLALHKESRDAGLSDSLIATVVFAAGVIAWGMFVRARRQLVLSLRERTHRAEFEQQLRVEQARHQERAQIAREMHDVLAHRLSLLSMHAGALEFRPDAPPAELERAAGVVRASAHQALEDLREVIGVLRHDEADGGPERPQPALVNAARPARRVTRSGHARELRIPRRRPRYGPGKCRPQRLPDRAGGADQRPQARPRRRGRRHTRRRRGRRAHRRGPQPPPARRPGPAQIPGTGSGLIGLAERASLAGGRLEHGRTPDGDFRLRAWLPWPA